MLSGYVPYFVKSAVKLDGDRVLISSTSEHGASKTATRNLLRDADGKEYFYFDSRRYSLSDDFDKIRRQRLAEMYY